MKKMLLFGISGGFILYMRNKQERRTNENI